MKITNNRVSKMMRFHDMPVGTTFLSDNNLFIKSANWMKPYDLTNCYNITQNHPEFLGPDDKFDVVDIEVIIT